MFYLIHVKSTLGSCMMEQLSLSPSPRVTPMLIVLPACTSGNGLFPGASSPLLEAMRVILWFLSSVLQVKRMTRYMCDNGANWCVSFSDANTREIFSHTSSDNFLSVSSHTTCVSQDTLPGACA